MNTEYIIIKGKTVNLSRILEPLWMMERGKITDTWKNLAWNFKKFMHFFKDFWLKKKTLSKKVMLCVWPIPILIIYRYKEKKNRKVRISSFQVKSHKICHQTEKLISHDGSKSSTDFVLNWRHCWQLHCHFCHKGNPQKPCLPPYPTANKTKPTIIHGRL